MTSSFSMLKFGRMQLPVRRVLALDAGSRSLRLLLAQTDFGRLRLLKEEIIDLQEEGLVAPEETQAHIQTLLDRYGRPPLAMVLPQHLSTSQVVDLPLVPDEEVEKLVHDESVKLSGASDSRIVYDFIRTDSHAKNHQQFWVTLCQEGDIKERLVRLGVDREAVCDVTTTANALICAFRALRPGASRAILVHLGAQSSVISIILEGQGVFASSFQMGGDFLSRSLARVLGCTEEHALSLKRSKNLFEGADANPEFVGVVEGWAAELKRQLNEWFDQHPGMAKQASAFQLIASGAAFEQQGLLKYLRSEAGLEFEVWPVKSEGSVPAPSSGFEVAFGTALQALGYSAQPVSLLPEDYRLSWRKRLTRQRIDFASLGLMMACVLLLSLGTWHQLNLVERKKALQAKVTAGMQAVNHNEALLSGLTDEYELLRPFFAAQQYTADTLQTYAFLQASRTNRSFWFVALADQNSYFSMPLSSLTSTNRAAKTNVTAGAERIASSMTVTNLGQPKPGLIAELCVPEEPEAARALLSQVVNELKQKSIFAKVDLLSEDLRRSIADPKVVLTDRHFVLSLDYANTDFQQPLKGRKSPVRGPARRPSRTAWQGPPDDGFGN